MTFRVRSVELRCVLGGDDGVELPISSCSATWAINKIPSVRLTLPSGVDLRTFKNSGLTAADAAAISTPNAFASFIGLPKVQVWCRIRPYGTTLRGENTNGAGKPLDKLGTEMHPGGWFLPDVVIQHIHKAARRNIDTEDGLKSAKPASQHFIGVNPASPTVVKIRGNFCKIPCDLLIFVSPCVLRINPMDIHCVAGNPTVGQRCAHGGWPACDNICHPARGSAVHCQPNTTFGKVAATQSKLLHLSGRVGKASTGGRCAEHGDSANRPRQIPITLHL